MYPLTLIGRCFIAALSGYAEFVVYEFCSPVTGVKAGSRKLLSDTRAWQSVNFDRCSLYCGDHNYLTQRKRIEVVSVKIIVRSAELPHTINEIKTLIFVQFQAIFFNTQYLSQMYRGFQFTPGNQFGAHYRSFLREYIRQKDEFMPFLEDFTGRDGLIDAEAMQNQWFPNIKADVFISHAHMDEGAAVAFAGWLKDTFGLNAFIDSMVWGNAADLQRQIDRLYCWQEESGTYNYATRNRTTAHVHNLLNNALSRMIDGCECFFFLSTPAATFTDLIKNKTTSPWIFSEITMSKLIFKKTPARWSAEPLWKTREETRLMTESKKEFNVAYPLQDDELRKLNAEDLQVWQEKWPLSPGRHPLDLLYGQHP